MLNSDFVQCSLCGHTFHPGDADGFVYCPACGRRFNPHSTLEETVVIHAEGGEGVPAVPSEAPTRPSRRFGEYDIVDEIARGGMGVVYLARQRVLKRVVALKVLRSGDNASPEERERLLREAKAAAGLSHPNIVPIHEFSIHQGQPYFTMDFIEGQPLDRLVEGGPLHVREAVAIIETVARAISYAHARGIIHRDLKPANIIIDPSGRPMVTDFGLAVEQTPEGKARQRMTMSGSIMGTIPYAPPEQAAGKLDQISERSDVYAMGAVLYELVTGRPPFTGFTQFELMRRVINHDPTPPRQINPKVHRDVETMILKCLEKDQRRRYDSAKAFADDCQSFLKGEVIAARPTTLAYRLRRYLTRRPLVTFLYACIVFLSLAVWVGVDHFRVLAKEKEKTEMEKVEKELELEEERLRFAKISQEMEETERQVRRDWRAEYTINFDYYFNWDSDMERSRTFQLPWLNPEVTKTLPNEPPRVKILTDPPRLALIDYNSTSAGPDTPFEGAVDLGLPFSFPREVRVVLQIITPAEKVGELLLSLDVDRNYQPHLGTTTVRFGSASHPGVNFYRSGSIIGEEPAYVLRPGATHEIVLERADDFLRAYVDNQLVLEAKDPPALFNTDLGRLALDVKDGTLEFLALSVELRGMSRNLTEGLIDLANTMAAQGRAELALRLYTNVLLEPTDPQNRLKALRGYARSLWLGLPRRDRGPEGIERACRDLNRQLASASRAAPGEVDFITGLALSLNPANQREGVLALQYLDKAAATSYSAAGENGGEYGDLAKLESVFVYLRMSMPEEAARRFNIMFEDGTIGRLYDRYGSELGGGGQAALLLDKADPMLKELDNLELAATLLRAAAAISPSSRECANRFRRLGIIYNRRDDSAKAVEYLHWAERLSPDWYRPYLDEANIHFINDEAGKAADALERAKASIPQSIDLHYGIAKMYLEDLPEKYQDPVRAEEAARTLVTLSQGRNPAGLEILARALDRQERHAEALEFVEAAQAIEKTEARSALHDKLTALAAARKSEKVEEETDE